MNGKTLYMIGNAHIDPVWLWQWQEGFHEVKATFRSALDRLAEYDDFVFVASSAAFYDWVERSDPAMFAEIQARVAEGRWRLVGGWWIEPDCNIPGGESYVRQALYGQRYFLEKFGRIATTGFNVDSFGHHAMLPQILRKSRLHNYVFMRPQPHEKTLPAHLFWWEADDGSRVLTFRVLFEYCTWGKDLAAHIARCADALEAPLEAGLCFYGVGNHGGGPTRENIESIRRCGAAAGAARLAFSDPDTFFEDVAGHAASAPVVRDELQYHAVGCYSAHSGIKRWNRTAENSLITAERFSAIASHVTGQRYPDLAPAWHSVLFNQFHDIMAGTSLESAYDDARHLYGEAMAQADRALNYAVQALMWHVDIPYDEQTQPLVVFNPHAWQSFVPVETQVRGLLEQFALVDDQDRRVAVQKVQSQAAAGGQHRLAFVADLPPLGYRTYRIVPAEAADAPSPLRASDTLLENSRFRLTLDPATGCIASLVDKLHAVELFNGPAARPAVFDDPSDTWSHDVASFQDEIGAFTPTRLQVVEQGPVKATLRVASAYGRSTLVQDFTVYTELDTVDVRVTVDWREQHKLLKLQFPINVASDRATYEIPYGFIERPTDGHAEAGQSWLDLTGTVPGTAMVYGLSLLNDGKYAFDVDGTVMSLVVLRSPIYAHHTPFQPDPNVQYSYIDQGRQQFSYALRPHPGGWQTAGTVQRAAELNHRAIALLATFHPGPLPQAESFLQLAPDNIVLSVIKQAEDGDDLVVRCYETTRTETAAEIALPRWHRVIRATFGPCEIKTFRVPKDPSLPVVETDLLEFEDV